MAHSASHLLPEGGFVSPALSQRAVMFAAIVALHVVLVYLFASGLAANTIKVVFAKTDVTFLDEPQTPDEAPPPPPMDFVPTRVDPGPEPVIELNLPSDPGTAITTTPPVAEPRVVEPAPPRVEPIHLVGKHQLPNTEDYYPPAERRLGIEGATNISVCVDERGKRTGEPTVTGSSGNAHFDAAAIQIGRAGKYARSARGETFVPSCHGFRIVFTMK